MGQILSGWQAKLEAQRAIFEGEATRVLALEHSVHGGFSIVAALAKDVRELEGAQERLDRDLEAMETAQGQMGETLDVSDLGSDVTVTLRVTAVMNGRTEPVHG